MNIIIVPVVPERWDYNKTIQDVGSWLYYNGYINFINYYDIVNISINNEIYYPILDFKNNRVILTKEQ